MAGKQTCAKKWMTLLLTLCICILGIAGSSVAASAAARTAVSSFKLSVGSRNVTKKTYSMDVNEKASVKVTTKPAAAGKSAVFKSSNSAVASVSKKGVITARKAGAANITVTVSSKKYQRKTTWVTVYVRPETSKTPDTGTANSGSNNNTGNNSGNNTGSAASDKILVAYFSWSGTSQKQAEAVAAQTGGELYRIERETPYSTDYNTVAYGEAKDEADANARPPLKDPLSSVSDYNKIVLCYPIWWHTAPMVVGTFLERYDWSGKTIYPISQSASMSASQYEESLTFIRGCAKNATVDAGLFSRNDSDVTAYVSGTVLKN